MIGHHRHVQIEQVDRRTEKHLRSVSRHHNAPRWRKLAATEKWRALIFYKWLTERNDAYPDFVLQCGSDELWQR